MSKIQELSATSSLVKIIFYGENNFQDFDQSNKKLK